VRQTCPQDTAIQTQGLHVNRGHIPFTSSPDASDSAAQPPRTQRTPARPPVQADNRPVNAVNQPRPAAGRLAPLRSGPPDLTPPTSRESEVRNPSTPFHQPKIKVKIKIKIKVKSRKSKSRSKVKVKIKSQSQSQDQKVKVKIKKSKSRSKSQSQDQKVKVKIKKSKSRSKSQSQDQSQTLSGSDSCKGAG
jgi:hypothetical protein